MKTFLKGFFATIGIVIGAILFWYKLVPILHDWVLSDETHWRIFLGVCVVILACIVGAVTVFIKGISEFEDSNS